MGHYASSHSYPLYTIPLSSPLCHKRSSAPSTSHYHTIFSPFYFSFWSGPWLARPLGHFLPSFPLRPFALLFLFGETNLPLPKNQRDNFVGQGP